MTIAKQTSLSIQAACAVMSAEGFGENAMVAVVDALKASGLIRRNEWQGASVMLSDLRSAMAGLA